MATTDGRRRAIVWNAAVQARRGASVRQELDPHDAAARELDHSPGRVLSGVGLVPAEPSGQDRGRGRAGDDGDFGAAAEVAVAVAAAVVVQGAFA